MPELPEVETVRRTLAPVLVGATVVAAVRGAHPDDILLDPWPVFARSVRGREIESLERRGKYLAFRLRGEYRLVVHLGMTGELRLSHPAAPVSPHCHLALVLRSAHPLPPILVDPRQRFLLRYHDIRRFGRIALLDPAGWEMLSARLGPEPLDPALTALALWERLHERRSPIKSALLDQALIAGVGNIYADEALFRAGIHPERHCTTLRPDEVERLLAALRAVLTEAIASAGTTIRDYRDGTGRAGSYQFQLQVYGKEPGTPCPRCGAPLERVRIAGRSSTFCPRCQPLR
ncbi:bifunctional DNA-formamidopyrimidine glycosylase/DNA-(apurinic or apyrimidinic site) lyase [Thermomicrobium sp. 4228-Ro]|uniref:bifunctional DNA-formamidopyrimidine glycosylase/DNA-(apurinic or apyrimidinic site) lyase n=1 Tax=Thermomicrobium sp. 4228-Ro TaxID=2993937 RepID=UPI002248B9DA|nr:bifunctional DNA-formamidopyrimidine glycosylase/DNA-(apurinic or apyrimidinic site) lyase [Thermomicrobium sp. 4228-Ro]MCX2726976.1 bifunctional DNA-formamidopyrimidine glycosylase/DNA-(apurinic or apyrimidinic site) lyase [Thermomicrobium sp. 4228-Ro]